MKNYIALSILMIIALAGAVHAEKAGGMMKLKDKDKVISPDKYKVSKETMLQNKMKLDKIYEVKNKSKSDDFIDDWMVLYKEGAYMFYVYPLPTPVTADQGDPFIFFNLFFLKECRDFHYDLSYVEILSAPKELRLTDVKYSFHYGGESGQGNYFNAGVPIYPSAKGRYIVTFRIVVKARVPGSDPSFTLDEIKKIAIDVK